MSRRLISAVESVFGRVTAYYWNQAAFPAVTLTGEGASAPSGNKWWRLTGGISRIFGDFPAYTATPTLDYIVCRGLRIEGTLVDASKELVRFGELAGDDLRIFRIRVSDGTFTIDVRGTGGTGGATIVAGTKVLNTSQTFTVRISADGTTVTLETDGEADGSASSSRRITTRDINIFGSDESGVEHYFDTAGAFEADSDADRPGYDVDAALLNPNANTAEDDYGDQTDCSGGGAGLGDYTRWDDWPGTPDDDTTYNCAGARNAKQTSALTTATLGGVISGAIYRIRRRATSDLKVVDNWGRLIEGANVAEVLLANIGSDGWRSTQHLFLDPPDGGAWTQAKVDALEAGHRVVDTNTNAGAQITALGVALIAVNDDPLVPVTEDRRRALIQQVI